MATRLRLRLVILSVQELPVETVGLRSRLRRLMILLTL